MDCTYCGLQDDSPSGSSHSMFDCTERLRAQNAELLAALKWIAQQPCRGEPSQDFAALDQITTLAQNLVAKAPEK